MFEKYPKIRPELPDKYKAVYSRHIKENREGCARAESLSQKIESWMHKKVAQDVRGVEREVPTLEIGAGTLNQLIYENSTRPYDIVEPFKELFATSDYLTRIRNIYSDISEISTDPKYERIICVATLEHVLDLPDVVARVGMLLVEGGHFRIGIPSEGTWLWKLGWKLTTGLEFKFRYNLDYEVIMKYEHVNTADEIEEVLNYFFDTVKCRVFGLSKNISLYRFYDCFKPDKLRCSKYIEDRA